MAGLGVFVLWLGYWIGYWGLDQVRGGNNGFLSLGIPGKYTDQAPDKAPAPAPTAPVKPATLTNPGQGITTTSGPTSAGGAGTTSYPAAPPDASSGTITLGGS